MQLRENGEKGKKTLIEEQSWSNSRHSGHTQGAKEQKMV